MRYKQKETPLSENLQLQGKQYTGLQKLSTKFYINGCASPVIPKKYFRCDKQRRVQGVCGGGTEQE